MKKNYLKNNNRNCNDFSKPVSIKKQFSFNSNWFLTLVVVLLATFSSNFYAQTATEIITTTGAGTWNVPAGITSIKVEVWGSGGSGGGSALGKDRAGSGGTGGTYATSTFAASGTYNYFVAPITTAVSSSNGNNGVSSWFNTSMFLNGNGGLRGLVGDGAAVTAVTTGSAGTTIIAGGSTLAGTTTFGSAGGAGGNGGGAGGLVTAAPSNGNFLNGNPGSTPGGGGSGGSTGGGSCGCTSTGGTGARGEIRITYLKITSLGSTSGCVGSSITINGTDFTGATAANVRIGGTPVTSITSNSGTQIVAVVGAGTTGTVSITIAGKGTTTSAATFTVNPSPSISTQPVATNVCTSGSTTFGVVASGVTTYQWRRNGVNLTNVAPYSNVTTATLTLTNPVVGDAGNFDVVLNSATCPLTSNSVALTVNATPSASITPTPSTGATGVCHAGNGVITSISWAATATATSYDVYFGTVASPVTLSANVTTNSYTTGALAANTTYYWRVVAKNACGNGASSVTWSFTTAATPCVVYCTPTASSVVDGTGITNVSYSTVNNTTNNLLAYNNYTSFVGNVIQGAAMPISVTTATGNKRYNIKIWIDWNDDGDFDDAGEQMFSGIVLSNTINGIINVPLTAIIGNHRMRVGITQGQGNGINYENATPCFTGVQGAFEDYTINVTPAVVCTLAPTLTTSPPNTTMASNGTATLTASFANGPTNFVWEVSTDGGTNFTTITNTGVYSGANTTALTITNPTGVLNGFIYRVTASNACGTSPVSATALLTVTITYCTPASSTNKHWIATVFSDGNLNDTSYSGAPAYSTSPVNGYGNYSSTVIARQAPGGGVNISYILGSSEPVGGANLNLQRVSCFVDWNGDGDFLDANEIVYTTGNVGVLEASFGFVVPLTQNPGIYRMRIRTRQTIPPPAIDGCTAHTTGETEDYSIAIVPDCAARIQSVSNGSVCGANNTITLAAVGLGGTTQYRWYNAQNGGLLVGTSVSSSWTTPALPATTVFYVTAFNGSCESLTRTPVKATVNPTNNITFSPTSPTVCGENNIISIQALGDNVELDLLNESFENGFGSFSLTTITNTSNTGPQANAPWSVRTNTYQPTDTSVWRPAINSGNISENFAITTSDYSLQTLDTRLTTTNDINTTDFINLTLTFKHYYSDYGNGDTAAIEVSTDGGGQWLPANIVATYNSDLGAASKFQEVSINLNAYVGITTLKFRFKYVAGWNDGWAIDDVRLFGTKVLNTTFSWSDPGVNAYIDAACLIPYVAQTVTTIYVKPTSIQLGDGDWTFTTTTTLGNGCPVSKIITVTNKSKVWQGGTPSFLTNWETAANWKPTGVPTADNCVIIPSTSIIPGSSYQAFAKNLTVKPTGNLNITSGSSLTVTDFVNVNTNGIFTVNNNGSLVQINNIINSGNITYKRIAQQRRNDYVYWSSPVENFNLNSHPSNGAKYSWNTLLSNPNLFQGYWEAASGIMNAGQGYIVSGPSSFNNTANQNLEVPFFGVPRNGDITIPIYRGTNTTPTTILPPPSGTVTNLDDNWNLLGNPYPSAINCRDFLTLNASILTGAVYIWTHSNLPSSSIGNPFYANFGSNYNPIDYIPYNLTGFLANTYPDYYIGAGQGFFVTMIDGSTSSANVIFNNSLRSNTYGNSTGTNFYRTTGTTDTENLEFNRIWLELNKSNISVRTLVGYVSGATMEKDNLHDAISKIDNSLKIFSVSNEDRFVIQGRSLPFNNMDQVKIGIDVYENGQYSIGIAMLDGLFLNETQNIFLEDKVLNVIHNLRQAPYVFTAIAGTYTERFVLRYTNNSLGNPTQQIDTTFGFINNHILKVQSTVDIKQITIYDITGKEIKTYKVEGSSNHFEDNFPYANGVYIVKITLENDVVVKKKLIH